jgi:hypothetical protein
MDFPRTQSSEFGIFFHFGATKQLPKASRNSYQDF